MSKGIAQRQRIGPQIRHLRQLRGLTLDDLANAAGLSASHLSRLERSQTLPSFTVLANIAQVLDVSIDEFVQLEHDLQELDEQLAWQSELLALDDNAYQEILGLSIDTRRQLNRAIELLSDGIMPGASVQETVARPFTEHERFEDAIAEIEKLIDTHGQNGVGMSRALSHLAEIPGPRIGLLADAGMLTTTPNTEYAAAYRGIFPGLPLDPSVARRWGHWTSQAADAFPFDWSIKLILKEDVLDRMRDRFSAECDVDGARLVGNVARYWHRMLSDGNDLTLAVTSRRLPRVNVLSSINSAALFERVEPSETDPTARISLWVSGAEQVRPVTESLQQLWDSIDEEEKNPASIRTWLESYFS